MFLGELIGKQNDAANKLCARKKLLLAYPQGTGKSVIALAAAEKLLELGYIKHITILCQTNITWQWEERIKEFTNNDVRLTEAKNKSSRVYGTNETVYQIVPYSLFRNDSKAFLAVHHDLVIADEAQEFSNYSSRTLKLIKKLKPNYRWALTGTAISNKLEDLYNIMRWVDPYFLPPWYIFERKHIVRNPATNQIVKYKNLETLNRYLLSKRLERKTLEELQDLLPKLCNHTKYVEKTKEVERSEKKLFKALGKFKGTHARFDGELSRAFHEARQALLNEAKLKEAIRITENLLADNTANRIVLFSFYKQPLYILHRYFGNKCIIYTGDDTTVQKQSKIKWFEKDQKILLASKAGSVGLDLPFANYIIHLDVPFSFGNLDQRSKRIQRTSSIFKEVIVIQLLVKDSIEEYYYNITQTKGILAKAALEGGIDEVIVRPQSLKNFLSEYQRKS